MTVVRCDDQTTLICDICGDTVDTPDAPADGGVVWTLVSDLGWTGSPLAEGPHRCAHCTLSSKSGGAPVDDSAPGPGGILGIDHSGGATVITCAGDIDVDGEDTLRTALRHAADMGGSVVVDVTHVRLIDSTGLGLLVRAHRDAVARGAAVSLAAPSPFLRTVLRTLRLEGVLPVFDSRDEAVEHATGRAGSSTTAVPRA
ncbi:STAS domain-containing protein [Micromonospora sp. WMMA1363]|uniref:STAS domain-containing protein n=1 Tax=Micromonospora sp. WMMA1363 TaxID=3053985 RepID=UPI00259D18A5|nr:STAS domain-containing protein [Micromonospora sp. WMMA1363]MDM4719064.1 STAS domain-containing protein [Micromonospora sp. WMMA1363]